MDWLLLELKKKKKIAIKGSIKQVKKVLDYYSFEIPWTEEPGRLQSMGLQESDMT